MKTKSKIEKIKSSLLTGRKVSTLWGMVHLSTSKMATRISELKVSGWPIKSEKITVNGTYHMEYWIPKEKLTKFKKTL